MVVRWSETKTNTFTFVFTLHDLECDTECRWQNSFSCRFPLFFSNKFRHRNIKMFAAKVMAKQSVICQWFLHFIDILKRWCYAKRKQKQIENPFKLKMESIRSMWIRFEWNSNFLPLKLQFCFVCETTKEMLSMRIFLVRMRWPRLSVSDWRRMTRIEMPQCQRRKFFIESSIHNSIETRFEHRIWMFALFLASTKANWLSCS